MDIFSLEKGQIFQNNFFYLQKGVKRKKEKYINKVYYTILLIEHTHKKKR